MSQAKQKYNGWNNNLTSSEGIGGQEPILNLPSQKQSNMKEENKAEDRVCKTPIEDLRASALQHYEEASSAIHHWNSFVVSAIEAYNPATPSDAPKEGMKEVKSGLKEVYEMLCKISHPYHEYSDNEAACEMALAINHIREFIVYELLPGESPAPYKPEGLQERKFTLEEMKDAFTCCYNMGKVHPGNNKNKDAKQYFKEKFNINL